MEIKTILIPAIINGNFANKLEWYIYLTEDEEKFQEEIKQEMNLNMQEQFGGKKLW